MEGVRLGWLMRVRNFVLVCWSIQCKKSCVEQVFQIVLPWWPGGVTTLIPWRTQIKHWKDPPMRRTLCWMLLILIRSCKENKSVRSSVSLSPPLFFMSLFHSCAQPTAVRKPNRGLRAIVVEETREGWCPPPRHYLELSWGWCHDFKPCQGEGSL